MDADRFSTSPDLCGRSARLLERSRDRASGDQGQIEATQACGNPGRCSGAQEEDAPQVVKLAARAVLVSFYPSRVAPSEAQEHKKSKINRARVAETGTPRPHS